MMLLMMVSEAISTVEDLKIDAIKKSFKPMFVYSKGFEMFTIVQSLDIS